MEFLRNSPIKRKLTLLTMLTSGVALLLAAIAFIVFEAIDFRHALVEEVTTTAEMTGYNSSAALSFNEPASAEQALKSLGTHGPIVSAAIYDHEGQLFVSYQNANAREKFVPPPIEHNVHHFNENSVEVFRDIIFDNERVGTIYICHSLDEFWKRLWRYIFVVLLVMATASAVAYLLSNQLQAFISRPISHLSSVVGSVAFRKDYSLRALKENDDELGSLIDGFNEMLSEIQQRDTALQLARNELEKRVEERTRELASSLSLLSATLDSTADGILAIQFSGEVVCFNSQFAVMWGIPPEALVKTSDAAIIELTAAQVRDPEHYLKRIRELHADPETETFDLIELKDGRFFERYVKPQRIDGKMVGLVINSRDVTKRREDALELERIHRQLLDTSRQAGMAEVATSVLHNIGNVLNSVNISCSVVSEKVRRSRVASVTRTATLLHHHAGNLGAFFATDPTGQKIPSFLEKLGERLAGEQTAILGELQLLGQNIEHIKNIVGAQQSYAKNLRGVCEMLSIEGVIEDALRINDGGLTRYPVETVRQISKLPPMPLDKHKVLQILVNLIRNAHYALKASSRNDPQLLIRVESDSDRVAVSLTDNGIGIAPENMTRIFAHGFTTKKDGHGFGLHSGVLAAQQMGGRLTAFSDGLGKGATFTLELPLNLPEENRSPQTDETPLPQAGPSRPE